MSLAPILELKLEFHRRITTGDLAHVGRALAREGIEILDGFLREIDLVRAFFDIYYSKPSRRVAICGINPGRLGAGKSGLPFLDFETLGRLMKGHHDMGGRRGRERSAAFVAAVMDGFGPRRFFDGVYLTNLSWFGFVQGGRNLNHDRLSPAIQEILLDDFVREMEWLRPTVILPAGRSVAEGLARLRESGRMGWPVGPRLSHPNYCAFPAQFAPERQRYQEALTPYLDKPDQPDTARGESSF